LKHSELLHLFKAGKVQSLIKSIESENTIHIDGLLGSAYSLVIASVFQQQKGFHLVVLPDKETAAYLYNDLENLFDDVGVDYNRKKVMFYPSAYKRPYETDHPDSANLLSRTEVLARVNSGTKDLILVSFSEALSEKVVSKRYVSEQTIFVRQDDELEQDGFIEKLAEMGFSRVDFVVEPGQFALRGGLMDVFSYAYDHPYRIEFFGDDIESIRTFDPVNQLSLKKLKTAKILPNLQRQEIVEKRSSFIKTIPNTANLWIQNPGFIREILEKGYQKAILAFEELKGEVKHLHPKDLFLDAEEFTADSLAYTQIISQSKEKNIQPIIFNTRPQPNFNKQFDLLLRNMKGNRAEDIKTIIVSDSEKQLHRLHQIFEDIEGEEYNENLYHPLQIGLHQGFIDDDVKIAVYTDHQIFNRYQRFKLREGFGGKETITLKELYNLTKGDYVTHVDHGIGQFDGLQKITNNGKVQEVIRLIYKNNDLLYVNIHSLHRISKYSGKEATPPKVNKIGSPAWNKLKSKTKKKVKDIAKDLIKLYAERKDKPGFAFSPDTYLQTELEASFIYEDTPDQVKTNQDVTVWCVAMWALVKQRLPSGLLLKR